MTRRYFGRLLASIAGLAALPLSLLPRREAEIYFRFYTPPLYDCPMVRLEDAGRRGLTTHYDKPVNEEMVRGYKSEFLDAGYVIIGPAIPLYITPGNEP